MYSSLKVLCIVCEVFACVSDGGMLSFPTSEQVHEVHILFLSEELMVFIPLGVHNMIKTDYDWILRYISKCHQMEQTTFRALKNECLPVMQLVKRAWMTLKLQQALLSTVVIDSTRPVFIYVGSFFICEDIFWRVHNDA